MIEQTSKFSQDTEQDYEVICDNCEENIMFGFVSWQDMIQELKELGWQITKIGNVWMHYCPRCM